MSPENLPPVVRFAPSPTGTLHVGGARTALFNWAYARGRGGRFLLRLEDTDRARSTEAAERGILEDLSWLGLDWDNAGEEPRQSRRLDLYNDAVERLLASGHAYEDEGAVRFQVPDDEVRVEDLVLGEVLVPAGQIADFVIRKSDGYPTFHMAVVIDDADMGVTHVIRGQEHLNNTPKHALLLDALGLPRPAWAHLPLIFNPDGSKMSKRDKAKAAREAVAASEGAPRLEGVDPELRDAFLAGESDDPEVARAVAGELGIRLPEIDVADFRASGYLPEVLCNYLALLGWGPGDDTERFDLPFLVDRFSLDRVGRSHARFDREKLYRFNAESIAALDAGTFEERWRAWCALHRPRFLDALDERTFAALARAYQPRSRTLAEPCEMAAFAVAPDEGIAYDGKAVAKVLLQKEGAGLDVLRELRTILADQTAWSAGDLEAVVEGFAAERGLGMGRVAQPLRVAVTGSTVSPPIGATLEILGEASTLARIDRCLELHAGAGADTENA